MTALAHDDFPSKDAAVAMSDVRRSSIDKPPLRSDPFHSLPDEIIQQSVPPTHPQVAVVAALRTSMILTPVR